MTNGMPISPLLRILIGGACAVIVLAGMKAAAPVLNIILLAFLLAQSVIPFPAWLIRKGVKPGLSVLIAILIVIIVGSAIISVLGVSIADLIHKLPVYQEKLAGLRDSIAAFLTSRGFDAAKLVPLDAIPPKRIIELAAGILGTVAGTMGNGLLLLIVTIFMLIELVTVQQKLIAGEYPEGSFMHRFEDINIDTRKYIAITGVAGFVQAVINTVVLAALGVDYAVTFGVFFFFCNFIPAVGFFFALIPPLLIALLDSGWTQALYVLVGWWFVNVIFDNVIKPKFMKKGLDISLVLIIVGVIGWTWVLGPVGAILAIPLTMAVVRVVHFTEKVM